MISLKRINSLLLLVILIWIILYYGKNILIPICLASFLAMLVSPMSNKMEEKGIGRIGSSLISVLTVILALTFVLSLVFFQATEMGKDSPKIKQNAEKYLDRIKSTVEEKFHIPAEKQITFLKKQSKIAIESSLSYLSALLTGITGIISILVITVVFMFLLLYQREKYETFFIKLYSDINAEEVQKVVRKITKVSQHYLTGRLISIVFLVVMFTIGLTLIGVKNAFFLSLIAGLLTIIPYIGSIIGGLFPVLMALITEDSGNTALYALIVVVLISSIDNYFIEPYFVGGEVNLSAFFTILTIMIGGFMWGVAGMILFIPLFAIAKIIFDQIEILHPYGYLIGDQEKSRASKRLFSWFKKKF